MSNTDAAGEVEDKRVPVEGARAIPLMVRYAQENVKNHECYVVEYAGKVLMRDGRRRKVIRYPCRNRKIVKGSAEHTEMRKRAERAAWRHASHASWLFAS